MSNNTEEPQPKACPFHNGDFTGEKTPEAFLKTGESNNILDLSTCTVTLAYSVKLSKTETIPVRQKVCIFEKLPELKTNHPLGVALALALGSGIVYPHKVDEFFSLIKETQLDLEKTNLYEIITVIAAQYSEETSEVYKFFQSNGGITDALKTFINDFPKDKVLIGEDFLMTDLLKLNMRLASLLTISGPQYAQAIYTLHKRFELYQLTRNTLFKIGMSIAEPICSILSADGNVTSEIISKSKIKLGSLGIGEAEVIKILTSIAKEKKGFYLDLDDVPQNLIEDPLFLEKSGLQLLINSYSDFIKILTKNGSLNEKVFLDEILGEIVSGWINIHETIVKAFEEAATNDLSFNQINTQSAQIYSAGRVNMTFNTHIINGKQRPQIKSQRLKDIFQGILNECPFFTRTGMVLNNKEG